MRLTLSDDKEYWNQQVHLSDQVLVRAKILKYLVAPGIQESKTEAMQETLVKTQASDPTVCWYKSNKMNKVKEIKELAQQLEALTGKKVMFKSSDKCGMKESEHLKEVGEAAPNAEPAPEPEAIDNAERFENAMALNGALQKQIESALGVIAAKQQQQPDSSRFLALIARSNKGLEQIVKLLENPGQETEIAEMQLSDIQNETLESEILEVEGEPIQVYFPKGTRQKLKDRAKRAGKFTISDYIRSKVQA